ncbi:glycosyltransferase [Vibrio parahaemolyticus]|nr:glycosyltransferase [Vibrio parahaemolyticus]MDG2608950.1 glycosyltransferase [Vibrio parahaemolyticus]MDG2683797.1 glycosyltransferase [Vibrio parahaemolyticus]
MKIEVLVSTYNDGFNNIVFNDDFYYLIIHQVDAELSSKYLDAFNFKFSRNDKVRYIQCIDEKGLSKSRNVALENAVGDYLWIMDDDVEIFKNSYQLISQMISREKLDTSVWVLNYTTKSEDVSAYNLKNVKKSNLSLWDSFHVCSINMLMKASDIKGIRFDEKFGLGSAYPSGEEYIYISDVIKGKLKVRQTSLVASKHPPVSSGDDFYSKKNVTAAKVEMLKRVHGKLGHLIFFAFFLKKIRYLLKKKALITYVRNVIAFYAERRNF